ncbi:hypothetical protein SNEBB_006488 [Seison nebaliae]|nr:hypothetical protein SNEBB_006488 [Seison nebaliae]
MLIIFLVFFIVNLPITYFYQIATALNGLDSCLPTMELNEDPYIIRIQASTNSGRQTFFKKVRRSQFEESHALNEVQPILLPCIVNSTCHIEIMYERVAKLGYQHSTKCTADPMEMYILRASIGRNVIMKNITKDRIFILWCWEDAYCKPTLEMYQSYHIDGGFLTNIPMRIRNKRSKRKKKRKISKQKRKRKPCPQIIDGYVRKVIPNDSSSRALYSLFLHFSVATYIAYISILKLRKNRIK